MDINIDNLTDAQRESIKSQIEDYEKCNKPSAEDRFLELIEGMEVVPGVKFKKPDSVFFEKNDRILFEWDTRNNQFWVDYDSAWSVFGEEYGYNHEKVGSFLKVMVERHLKYKRVTPFGRTAYPLPLVERHLKYKRVTPDTL